MAKPWMTSDDLIASVKRDISFPTSQVTFTDEDILDFANEEMKIGQVPSILKYHEEYLVYEQTVPLESGKSTYPMPKRAIGMKLRDLFYSDSNGNLVEMTRLDQEDRAFYQATSISNSYVKKFYVKNNSVVLVPAIGSGAANGSLLFVYYLQPNQLVPNSRAATIQNFCTDITVNIATLVAGDTVTVDGTVFTAVASGPSGNEFLIGASNTATAENLATVINNSGAVTSATSTNAVVSLSYLTLGLTVESSNSAALSIPTTTCINFDQVPSHITSGSKIDFLQTEPGHKIYSYDIIIPATAISGTKIAFTTADVPEDLVVGDYICSQYECIIPQIPNDLHSSLSDLVSARILSAIGDREGLADTEKKIQKNAYNEGMLIDNRVEGAPQKVTNRHSLLRYSKQGYYKGTR